MRTTLSLPSLCCKVALVCVALLAVFARSAVLAQQDNPSDLYGSASQQAYDVLPNEAIPFELAEPDLNEVVIREELEIETADDARVSFGDWLGYNPTQNDVTWLLGDEFGLLSFESFPVLEVGQRSDLVIGTGFHFLNGPIAPDMPPRLFDFRMAYHTRQTYGEHAVLDLNLGVGAFSDFEGSSRKGIRFPGHAVTYYEWHRHLVTVLGVEVLDRDDISLLPVAGVVWRPHEEWVCELVFPRPRIQVKLDSDLTMYVGGELGGSTWAIERADAIATNDNVTYRDIRIVLGLMRLDGTDNTVFEIGWAFDRALEYRSGVGDYEPDDALILRLRTHY